MIKKKAQMEIIGLVVIVILITLGILFMAQFALHDKPQSSIFLRKELAASSVSTILRTTVKEGVCQEARPQLSEVLMDCARHFPAAFSSSILQCSSQHSCDFFTETAKSLLDKTLGSWRKRYELHAQLVRIPGASPEEIAAITGRGGCPVAGGRDRDSSGSFPLPTIDAGLIEVVLYICD